MIYLMIYAIASVSASLLFGAVAHHMGDKS